MPLARELDTHVNLWNNPKFLTIKHKSHCRCASNCNLTSKPKSIYGEGFHKNWQPQHPYLTTTTRSRSICGSPSAQKPICILQKQMNNVQVHFDKFAKVALAIICKSWMWKPQKHKFLIFPISTQKHVNLKGQIKTGKPHRNTNMNAKHPKAPKREN